MPKPATGSAFYSRGAWYARVTLDAGKRKAFRLTETTEATADARLVVLAEIAAKLRKAGHGDRAEAFVREAATASPEDLAAVVQLADALCRGEVRPIAPRPKPLPAGTETIATLAVRWTSGELARKYPDHVRALSRPDFVMGLLNKHVIPKHGNTPIADVTIEHLEEVMAAYVGETSSRRRLGMTFSRLLSLAVYPLKLIAASPIPRGFFGRAKGGDKAKVYLYPDEDRKLLACAAVDIQTRIYYGILAREGMRATEAERLLWRDVDLVRGAVTLDVNKTDDPRAWALSPGVLATLAAWKEMREEAGEPCGPDDLVFVFPGATDRRGSRARSFRVHLRLAGVDRPALFERTSARRRIRAHDLRATFVTIALANGRSEAWVADRTGHKSSDMINRYRRAARTVAELGMGDLAPLDEAIPEVAAWVYGRTNRPTEQKARSVKERSNLQHNAQAYQRGLIEATVPPKCANDGDGRARFAGMSDDVSRVAADSNANTGVRPDTSALALRASWAHHAAAVAERADAA